MASGPQPKIEWEIYPDNIVELIAQGRALRNQMICEAGRRMCRRLKALFRPLDILADSPDESEELHST